MPCIMHVPQCGAAVSLRVFPIIHHDPVHTKLSSYYARHTAILLQAEYRTGSFTGETFYQVRAMHRRRTQTTVHLEGTLNLAEVAAHGTRQYYPESALTSDIQDDWSERVITIFISCLRRRTYYSRPWLIHDMQRHRCVSHCYILHVHKETRRRRLCYYLAMLFN